MQLVMIVIKKIIGIRYKCSNCPDYDLCESCESVNLEKSLHDPTHVFLKIYRPIPYGIRNCIPNFYHSNVEQHKQKVEEKIEQNVEEQFEQYHPLPRSDLEARLNKVEGDLKKIHRLMSNKDKLKKEKPVSRREKRFGVKRKVEIQDQFVKGKEEKEIEKEEVKEEVKVESQSVIQLMKQFEPEIELKQSEPEIELKEFEPEIQLEKPQPSPVVFHPWEEQIILLQAMGFLDEKLNLELLDRYQDINRVVEQLL